MCPLITSELGCRANRGESTHPGVDFVTPDELRVTIPGFKLKDEGGRYTRTTPLRLTVVNGPLQLSAPAEIRVLPSAKFKREPLAATIRAITPSPVPMMDFQSPELLTLEIGGDNFRNICRILCRRGLRGNTGMTYLWIGSTTAI